MGGKDRTIGVIGGVGPYAGLDLVRKIFDQTIASSDPEHLSVILLSEPSLIPDRSAFLLGSANRNPAVPILALLKKLEAAGAEVAGIPCNTSHADRILGVLKDGMAREKLKIRLLNMIEETADFSIELCGKTSKAGLLATQGTYKSGVYSAAFGLKGLKMLLPDAHLREEVHQAIYDPEYGIKSKSNPPSQRARDILLKAAANLKRKGASSIVLGCTELPLAITEGSVLGLPAIDSTLVLARALIREAAPRKLKPH